MTSIDGRPNSALLVIDVQNDVVASAHRRDEVVATIGRLVERARSEAVPVVWVQHADDRLERGTPGWDYVPELQRTPDEPVVHKRYGDAFEDTSLEDELAALGVGRLVVAGAQSDACIRATLHGAFVRGYDAVLVADAHTTLDLTAYGLPAPEMVIAHLNEYWTWQDGPGRSAGVEPADEVQLRRTSG
ncbi:MAG: isochorismatase family protein [Actinobacteria bacterium]|nr:isochorismatase family protein [Actinomycetota bacterium]